MTDIDRTSCTAEHHGDEYAYTRLNCRCPDAREDRRLKVKRRRENRHQSPHVNLIGTTRRLRALAAIGWPLQDLGPMLGITKRQMSHYRAGRKPLIRRDIAARITALYEQLATTPGPNDICRQRAEFNGWAPPNRWLDVDIDDPNAHPEEPAALEPARRTAAVLVEDYDYLVSTGMSEELAAAQLGIKPESIGNARKRVRVSQARRAQIARKQETAA